MPDFILLLLHWFLSCLYNVLKPVYLFIKYRKQRYYGHKAQIPNCTNNTSFCRPPKPAWVRKEIIRLKALMIHDGSRKIADTFNRLYAQKKRMTVGKTYVCETIKKNLYEVQVLRRKIKHKKPRPMPKNLIWSLDLTPVPDEEKQLHSTFGIIDSGSRACLSLQQIQTKASLIRMARPDDVNTAIFSLPLVMAG